MTTSGLVVGLAVGLLVGVAVGLVLRSGALAAARSAEARHSDLLVRHQQGEATIAELRTALAAAQVEHAQLAVRAAGSEQLAEERAAALEETRRQLTGEFARLSAEALRANNEQFLQLAGAKLEERHQVADVELAGRQSAIEQMLVPIRDQLRHYDEGIRALERERQGAYGALKEQMQQLSTSHELLQKETRHLVTALRAPQARGQWGELQLRRVVEMAGMLAHCDFDEQVSSDADGSRLRPDLVVHLPGGKNVVVDAKVPMQAFLDANDATDETVRRAHLAAHGRQLRSHVDALAKKEYWQRVHPSPEFVVAFVPGDPLLTTAMEHDPGLMEHAVANNVLLATPTTLIALLRAVAYGWQNDALSENAREVQRLGAELYRRLSVFGDHLAGVGRSLDGAVGSYNRAVGSLEGRVLVTARRFSELGVVGTAEKGLASPAPVDTAVRHLHAPELADSALPEEVLGHGPTTSGDGGAEPAPPAHPS